jgi:hypothetical protein
MEIFDPASTRVSKAEFIPSNIYKPSSYLRGNTSHLPYKPNRLMLFGETIAAYYVEYMKHTSTLYGQKGRLCVLKLVAHTVTILRG